MFVKSNDDGTVDVQFEGRGELPFGETVTFDPEENERIRVYGKFTGSFDDIESWMTIDNDTIFTAEDE